ncbi:IS110 family transposase [Methylocaldum sp.]|uniref:IS110 family transposase n=1 Tax=Methylocaldum sp. TaxID=1969727 RepID=UPI002D2870CA|nr:IS110 family transposase [Methylocaldum sp.]HYE35202.1 IS110 family transposase [Methylocaldum sp.]
MQPTHENDFTLNGMLTVALELAKGSWKIALHDGRRSKPAIHTVKHEQAAGRLAEAVAVIDAIRREWRLGNSARVVVVYEAGQDGFWIERALRGRGHEVLVVDPASIPVERHARRAKTDRLDALRLLTALRGWLRGERDRMQVVRVPAPQAEAHRHLARERGQLQKEIGQHRDRLRKLLRTVGCWDEVDGTLAARLARGEVTCHDGSALPAPLRTRLERECERLALAHRQLEAVETAMSEQLPGEVRARIGHLQQLKGVGQVGATRLVLELFWRAFENRRQVGSCVGLVPQPYDSGESRVDQGISKQGNRRVRALLIEMAWMWLRYQPASALSTWFAQRTQASGPNKRGRRIAIVAVARRLSIALWRYLEDGVLPAGAVKKAP